MEILTNIITYGIMCAAFFFVGVWQAPRVRAIMGKKTVKAIEIVPKKPQNEFTDYTIEELESHKQYREREYRNTVHYPALRQGHAESLKLVLEMLDWHYTTNGTKDLEEQRARNKRDLEEFDEKYRAALRGV